VGVLGWVGVLGSVGAAGVREQPCTSTPSKETTAITAKRPSKIIFPFFIFLPSFMQMK
jgi:hypothetical protein